MNVNESWIKEQMNGSNKGVSKWTNEEWTNESTGELEQMENEKFVTNIISLVSLPSLSLSVSFLYSNLCVFRFSSTFFLTPSIYLLTSLIFFFPCLASASFLCLIPSHFLSPPSQFSFLVFFTCLLVHFPPHVFSDIFFCFRLSLSSVRSFFFFFFNKVS